MTEIGSLIDWQVMRRTPPCSGAARNDRFVPESTIQASPKPNVNVRQLLGSAISPLSGDNEAHDRRAAVSAGRSSEWSIFGFNPRPLSPRPPR